jgi:hypothetical protein
MGGETNGDDGGRYFREGLFEKNDIGQIGQRPKQVKKKGGFEKIDVHRNSF